MSELQLIEGAVFIVAELHMPVHTRSLPLAWQTALPALAVWLAGHYVVLCGHDAATDCFMVQDPASCRPYLRLPATTFDSARRAFGTDEDLLFISAEGRPLKWLMTPDCNPGV